jgi:cytochrome P450
MLKTELQTETPPTIKANAFNYVRFAANPLDFLTKLSAYGDIVEFGGEYYLNNPADLENILVNHQSSFHRNFNTGGMGRLLGNGLLASSGDYWLRQRRLMQPLFHKERVAAYGKIMTDFTEELLKEWRVGEIRDIHTDMMHLTVNIVAKVLFSYEERETIKQISDTFNKLVYQAIIQQNPLKMLSTVLTQRLAKKPRLVKIFPILKKRQLLLDDLFNRLDEAVYKVIQDRRQNQSVIEANKGDLLGLLMSVRDENGQGMSDKQLRDEVLNMFIAGHETAAVTLSWLWYLLDKHHEVQTKVITEIQQVLNARIPTVTDLAKLTYTEKVIKETLRVYSPLWLTTRKPFTDYNLRGYQIKAKNVIFINIYGIHHDPRYYPEPNQFRPERWDDEMVKTLPRFAFLAFGGGPRLCIGQAFGMQEILLVVATIAQKYKLELVAGQKVKALPSLTLRPKGLKMIIKNR